MMTMTHGVRDALKL